MPWLYYAQIAYCTRLKLNRPLKQQVDNKHTLFCFQPYYYSLPDMSSHTRCYMKKLLLKILQNSQENTSVGDSFLTNVASLRPFSEHFQATAFDLINISYSFISYFLTIFLGNNLNPSGQLNLAMLWNRVDIARNKILKEVAEKGQKWTVSYSKGANQSCPVLQSFVP